MRTLAPGTDPPDESVTLPRMPCWAATGSANANRKMAANRSMESPHQESSRLRVEERRAGAAIGFRSQAHPVGTEAGRENVPRIAFGAATHALVRFEVA